MKKKLKNIKKIYQGKKDGFKSKNFHLLVDNKGLTLIIIKSNKKIKFSGVLILQIGQIKKEMENISKLKKVFYFRFQIKKN